MSLREIYFRREGALVWIGCLFLSSFAALPWADAADFPPISKEIRELTEVPGQPGAAAVILFKDADFRFRDYPTEASSRLEVRVRLKILTEEGLSYGEVSVPHSRELRLDKLEGRTVTSDGTVLELPDDAVFREVASKSEKIFVTKAAFPGVDVGSIIDYVYSFYWDDFFTLEPWLFHDELPVVSSTITYFKPDNLGYRTWGRETSARKMVMSEKPTHGGLLIEVAMTQLAPIPEEPYSFPVRDLASRFMIIPTAISTSGQVIQLLEDWERVYRWAETEYKAFTKRPKELKKQAETLTAGLKTDAEKAERLFQWVRDEIATVGFPSIFVAERSSSKDALEARAATMTEKALMLEVMLEAVGIESRRLWISDRYAGRVDLQVANPTWFDGMILSAEVDGQTVYLDPTDTTLAFGSLPSRYESTLALYPDRKDPEPVITPVSPAALNRRAASLSLNIDAEGKASGSGRLLLKGHQARAYFKWRDSAEATTEAWQEKLEEEIPGWRIHGVSVSEDVDRRQITVVWQQEQRAEEILGDEVSLLPSRPLQLDQPFTLPVEKRLTPVQMAFRKLDSVSVEVTWPEGWTVDATPEDLSYQTEAGRVSVKTEVDETTRSLTFERLFERGSTEFSHDEYPLVKDLYERASKSDGQELVWILE